MNIVPPRVTQILRALQGLPPHEASQLLHRLLVGLDAVERASVRRLLPAQSPALAGTALALLSDPLALPTILQRGPMPWAPPEELAELVDDSPAPAQHEGAVPSKPGLADADAKALKLMMTRSRWLAAASISLAVGFAIGAIAWAAFPASKNVADLTVPPPPPLDERVKADRPADPELDALPPLKVARKHRVAPSAAPAPTVEHGLVEPKVAKDPRSGWAQWPSKVPHAKATPSKLTDSADDLTRLWSER